MPFLVRSRDLNHRVLLQAAVSTTSRPSYDYERKNKYWYLSLFFRTCLRTLSMKFEVYYSFYPIIVLLFNDANVRLSLLSRK